MPEFSNSCDTTGRSVEAAGHLAVEAVPDLWLYLPQDDLWFRVSSGVEAAQRITSRIEVFFGAIQRAAEKGLEAVGDGTSPPVDFSVPDMLERSSGGLGAGIPKELSNVLQKQIGNHGGNSRDQRNVDNGHHKPG
ncbi:hypothetical protein HSBAA_PA_4120 (plasmid) [Vreelandella sulfidaeris]|nr:hypothetical protein HSBAA_PA_4120 [Halomonas sulfidaeris]